MSVDYVGNAIPAPSYVSNGLTTTDPELLYSTVGYTQKGVTLKSGQGVLKAGTLLARDATTKKYVKTTVPGDALGILRSAVDTGAAETDQTFLGNILYAGILNLSLIQDANSGVTIDSTILGGTVNSVEGFFKF